MKNKLKSLIAFLVLILFSFNTFAEHELMTWGEIDEEHLKMTEYEADPDASVLFLGDYAEVFGENVDFDSYTAHKYYIRIKILTKEGLKYASHKIFYGNSKIKYIEAQSFTLQEDGSVKQSILDAKDIQTETVTDGVYLKGFEIPGAQVGSVIEYRYKKWTRIRTVMPPFFFQGDEPKLWSEIRFHAPKYTAYVTIPSGVLIKGMVEEKSRITLGQPNTLGDTYRYYMENIPAFREEPFTKKIEDYYAKAEFQLHSYSSGTGFNNSLYHTWEDLIEELIDNEELGGHLKGNSKFLKQVRHIYEGLPDSKQKMIAIYNHIRESITWDRGYSIGTSDSPNDLYKKRAGSSSAINLMLAIMLKDAGIETDLMLVSTRGHGFVIKSYPYIGRFNHLICRAKIDDDYHVLDAKEKYRPYNIVPANLIDCSALVIKEKGVEWVEITSNTAMTETINAHIKWNENEEMTAMVMEKNEGYAAMIEQKRLEEAGEKGYIKAIAEKWTDEEASNYKFQNKTKPKNLLVSQYELESDKFVSGDGTRLYFNTFAATGYTENPFKLRERLFPVDFNYPIKETNRFNIDIPKGYKAEEVPETAAFAMEGKAASFHITYSQQPNQIQVISTLKINEISLSPVQYQALKIFFDRIVEKQTELIVFSKEE